MKKSLNLIIIAIVITLLNIISASAAVCSNSSGHNYVQTYLCEENQMQYTCSYCNDNYKEQINPINIAITYTGEISPYFSSSEMSYISGRKYKISSTGGYGTIKYKYELYKSSTATSATKTTDYTTTTSYNVTTESYSFSGENYVLKITAKDEYGNISIYRFLVGDLSVISKSSENTGHNYKASVTNKTCKTLAKVTYTCIHCNNSYTDDVQDINISLLFKGTSQATTNGYGTYSRNYEIITSGGYGTLQYKGELYSTPTSSSSIGTFGFSTDSGFSVSTKGYSFVAGDKVVKITVKDSYGNSSNATFRISDESRLSYEVLPAEHGDEEWIVNVQPTCTETGSKKKACSVCGETISTEIVPANGHTESEWIVDNSPTCTEKGTKHKECTICKVVLSTSDIAANGHSYVSTVVPPTKTEDGYTIYTCHCGDSYKDNYTVLVYGEIFSTMEKGQEIFCVKPKNVSIGNNIILARYNNMVFAGMNSVEYSGETLVKLPIDKNITYDSIKLLIWSNLTSLKPIANAQSISIEEKNIITFKLNENINFQIQNKYTNIPIIISEDTPSKEGYEFKGWATEYNGAVEYKAGAIYSDNKDLTLYAVFGPISYTVSYDSNGGTNAPVSQEKNHDDIIYITDTLPHREGYSFIGWAKSSDGEIIYQPGDCYSDNLDITLYAIWEEKTYTVSYNLNYGAGIIPAQTKMHTKDLTLTKTVPARDGYDFLGWSNTATGDVIYNSGDCYSDNSNITLYAVWKLKEYTITYNANGGENAPITQTKIHNNDLTLSSQIPTKTGYNFKGWSTSVNGNVVYSSGDIYTNNSNVTLYAVWEELNYIITYNVNGGDSSIPSQSKPYWSSVNFTITKPTRQGYIFKGWSTTLNGTVSYYGGEAYSINSDIVLYAVWDAHTYTISYYVAYADGDIPNSQVKLQDVDIILEPVPPFKNGCQFAGWSTSRNGTVVYQPGDTYSLNENINLFDVWTYDISYDANGGIGEPEKQTFVYGNDAYLSTAIPIREGYDFMGWTTSLTTIENIYNSGEKYLEGTNLKLYAMWDKKAFNIIYDTSNGGINYPDAQCKLWNENLAISDTIPIRDGCTFEGWATTADGEVKYLPNDIYTENCDIVLYAVWKDITYAITYDANGGTNAPETQMVTYGNGVKLSSEIPAREGYNFLGWSTTAEGNGQWYNAGDGYTAYDNLSLYAMWEIYTYPVTYYILFADGDFPDSQVKTYNKDLVLNPTPPYREGCQFAGWSTSRYGEIKYLPGDIYSDNAAIDLYDIWTYDITYDANGGINAPDTQTFMYNGYSNSVALSVNIPTRDGYTFVGWSTMPDGSGDWYNPGNTYTGGANITLYAFWQENMYWISYDTSKGGTNYPDSQYKIWNEDIKISATIPQLAGYVFKGWSTTENGDVEYLPGDTYSANADVILYPIWMQSCGENLVWNLSSDGILTISGTGEMTDYATKEQLYPWFEDSQSIKKVVIEDGVTSISANAFDSCTNLNEIEIPDSVTSIGRYAFGSTGIKNIIIPNSVTTIGEAAFSNCQKLEKIDLSENLTTIEKYLFFNCSSLNEINISDNVTSIGSEAFSMCTSLATVKLGENVSRIEDYAFQGCSSLSSILLNENLTHLGRYAFVSCSSLNEINIRANNLTIGEYAFDCGAVTKINVESIDKWLNINFTSIDANPLNLTEGKLYINGELLTKLVIPEGITVIPSNALAGSNITELIISNTVTEIGANAFKGCYNLTNVVIPDNVITIGESAFDSCYNLTTLDIGNGVESIGKKAFYNDSSLQTIIFGKGIKNIGYQAFLFTYPASKYYKGSESDWANVIIEGGNGNITNITQYSYNE